MSAESASEQQQHSLGNKDGATPAAAATVKAGSDVDSEAHRASAAATAHDVDQSEQKQVASKRTAMPEGQQPEHPNRLLFPLHRHHGHSHHHGPLIESAQQQQQQQHEPKHSKTDSAREENSTTEQEAKRAADQRAPADHNRNHPPHATSASPAPYGTTSAPIIDNRARESRAAEAHELIGSERAVAAAAAAAAAASGTPLSDGGGGGGRAIESTSGGWFDSAPLLKGAMLIGAPIAACLMLALLFYLALDYFRRLRRARKERKRAAKKARGLHSASGPIGFITNGKLFRGGKSGKAADPADGISISPGGSASHSRAESAKGRDHRKAMDCRQLTINMEADEDELELEESTEESTDEAQKQKQKQKLKSNKQKSASSSSSATKTPKPPGQLRYALEYDFNKSLLTVSILEGRDLPGMDLNGSSDPYVKVFMLNNKGAASYRTKIHKRTLSPAFNETFTFPLAYAELTQQTLALSMYDYDRLSRHDEMGQVLVPLGQLDLAQRHETWAELRKLTDSQEGRLGDICMSLRYVPTAGKLNVVILEARQLKKMDVAGLSDPYVKLALTLEGKRLKKKKTSIKKCTLNPHYNESFSFELPFEQAQRVQLVITVVDYDRIGTSEPIGKVILGCEQTTGDTERRHWMDMLASPRRPIAQWHTLRDMDFEEFGSSETASGSQPSSSATTNHTTATTSTTTTTTTAATTTSNGGGQRQ